MTEPAPVPETAGTAAVTEPAEDTGIRTVRTAAFLADGRTTPFLIRETVAALAAHEKLQSAIVDISTKAGVATARQLMDSGIEYRLIDSLPPEWDEASRTLVEEIRSRSQGSVDFDADNVAAIDANIILAPAPAGDGGVGIDATEGTITDVVIRQMEAAGLNCMVILPPEAGLRRRSDGSYVRLTLKLGS